MMKIENTAGDTWLSSRIWMCESCNRAPAAFLCKADAASLCAACDSDIHSANPLARRHHRVPIVPGTNFYEDEDDEAASWILNGDSHIHDNGPTLLDEYLDLDDYNQFNDDNQVQQQQHYSVGEDSVVPIQERCFQLGLMDSDTGYSYPASMSHNVSPSPVDVGVVPESTESEGSISHPRPSKGTIDLFSGPIVQMPPTQLSPMDREARVLRYREKKKARKFEKTIRYASRKAYAETRPRIKGRFAKRIVCTS